MRNTFIVIGIGLLAAGSYLLWLFWLKDKTATVK